MSDVAWKKFIIRVQYEQSANSERSSASDGPVFYFCRSCPLFRTSVKEVAEIHLSRLHQLDHDGDTTESDATVNASGLKQNAKFSLSLKPGQLRLFCAGLPVTNCLSVDSSRSSFSASSDCSSPASPVSPSSPSSPVRKESLSTERKRVTINLNTKPMVSIDNHPNSVNPTGPSRDSQDHAQNGARYVCTECHLNFDQRDLFFAHRTEHGVQNVRGCDESSNNAAVVEPIEIGRLRFVCTHCNRTFSSQKACEVHARKHAGKRRFKCQSCHTSYSLASSFNRHLKEFHAGDSLPTQPDKTLYPGCVYGNLRKTVNQTECWITVKQNAVIQYPKQKGKRGRPRRSSEWLLRNLDHELKARHQSNVEGHCNSTLLSQPSSGPDSRYRTILPRPTSTDRSQTPKLSPIGHPVRYRRQYNRKSYVETRERNGFLSPMLCDTVARADTQAVEVTDPDVSIVHQSSTVLPVDVSLTTVDTRLERPLDEATSVEQMQTPSHILTVSAAYARQLRVSTAQLTVNELPMAVNSLDCVQSGAQTSLLSTTASAAVVPTVQIYPSAWTYPSCSEPSGSEPSFSATIESAPDAGHSLGDSELSSVQLPQSALHLYPVFDTESQSTVYYVATTPSNNVSEVTGSSYAYLNHPQLVWLPDASDSALTAATVAGSQLSSHDVNADALPYVTFDGLQVTPTELTDLVEPSEVIDLNQPRASDSGEAAHGNPIVQPTYYDISPPAPADSEEEDPQSTVDLDQDTVNVANERGHSEHHQCGNEENRFPRVNPPASHPPICINGVIAE